MDIKLLTKFKDQLMRLKSFLQDRIKKLQKIPNFGGDVDAGDEETEETEEYSNQLSIAQNYKNKLADIDNALNKMGKQKYGICERCGKRITVDVLEAVPESRLCKACKKLVK